MMGKGIAALAFVALLATACGSEVLSPSAATVNGDEITTEDVREASEAFEKTKAFDQLAQQSGESGARRVFQQGYLSQLIRRRVLRPKAEEMGIEVDDEDVEERLEQIKQDFPSEEEFEKAVADQGLTDAELDQLVRDQILEERLRAEVTKETGADEDEVRAYYEENRANYDEVRASHILVKDKGLAERLASELQDLSRAKLEKRFAALAKRHSEDKASGAKGGDLGWSSPNSYVPEFSGALDKLEIGEISEPVKSQFGFHVIRLVGRRSKSFDAVRAAIEQELGGVAQDEAWQEWLTDAYREADIEVNSRYGEFDVATQQVVDAEGSDVPAVEESPAPESSPQS